MLGKAKELEKNPVYTADGWEGALHRIKTVKKGKVEVIVTRQDGEKETLPADAAVRFFPVGQEPKSVD